MYNIIKYILKPQIMINKKIMTLSPPRAMKLLSYNYAEKSPSLQTVTGFCLASVAAPADEYIRPMGPQPVRTFFSLNGPRLVLWPDV